MEPKEHLKDLYLAAYNQLCNSGINAQTEFVKAILILSTSSLALSVAHFEKAMPTGQCSNYVLWISWMLFLASDACVLISYLVIPFVLRKRLRIAMNGLCEPEEAQLDDMGDGLDWAVEGLNISAAVAFMFAAVLTIVHIAAAGG